jgi:hypothetical protein
MKIAKYGTQGQLLTMLMIMKCEEQDHFLLSSLDMAGSSRSSRSSKSHSHEHHSLPGNHTKLHGSHSKLRAAKLRAVVTSTIEQATVASFVDSSSSSSSSKKKSPASSTTPKNSNPPTTLGNDDQTPNVSLLIASDNRERLQQWAEALKSSNQTDAVVAESSNQTNVGVAVAKNTPSVVETTTRDSHPRRRLLQVAPNFQTQRILPKLYKKKNMLRGVQSDAVVGSKGTALQIRRVWRFVLVHTPMKQVRGIARFLRRAKKATVKRIRHVMTKGSIDTHAIHMPEASMLQPQQRNEPAMMSASM